MTIRRPRMQPTVHARLPLTIGEAEKLIDWLDHYVLPAARGADRAAVNRIKGKLASELLRLGAATPDLRRHRF